MKGTNPWIGSMIMLILIALLMPPMLQANDGRESSIRSRDMEHFEWLILVYIAADNDLGENGNYGNAALMDIEEMESSIPETGVRVLALTDLRGMSNSYLYDIRPDDSSGINSPTIPLSDIDPSWSDELDMGAGSTMEKFMEFSLTNTSYDRSMFVMWDHGSGWYMDGDISRPPLTRGFAQDENPARTIMYLDEMRDSFSRVEDEIGPFRFDIIGHDTCYMGMIEIFYQLSRWSDLVSGSMDEQPWYGYNYTFLSSLEGQGPHSPEDLASSMVDLFEQEYGASSDTYHTIVIADVRILRDEFVSAWDALARSLHKRMFHFEDEKNRLFNSVVGRAEIVGIDSADVGSLLTELIKQDIDHNVTQLASNALAIYDRMVIDSWIKPMGRNPKGTGITIYLPSKTLAYKSKYDGTTGFLDLTADTSWDEMIREYQDPVERLRMNLSVIVPETPGQNHSIKVDVFDMRIEPPIPADGASVYVNFKYSGQTNGSGIYVIEDIIPGNYYVEVFHDGNIDIDQIKALNRPPVAIIEPSSPSVGEGLPIILRGNGSYDPDDDPITFSWDVDSSDGLNDTDSTGPTVSLTFQGKGPRTVRLTVNDSEASHNVDVVIDVYNMDPIAHLICPLTVNEDEIFTLDGSSSTDSVSDMGSLEYRFLMDDDVIRTWSSIPLFETSINVSGLHQIKLQVRDGSGGMANTTVTIDVRNLEPKAILNGPSVLFEDEIGHYFANASYDSGSDLRSLVYRWYVDDADEPAGSGKQMNITWTISGIHHLDLVVFDGPPTDPGTLMNSTRQDVRVDNVIPTASIKGPSYVNESETIFIDGTGSYDSISDVNGLEYHWDLDDDGEYEVGGASTFFVYDSGSTVRIALRVTDDDGDISIAYHQISIRNVIPTPDFTIPPEIWEDEPFNVMVEGNWDTMNDIPDLDVTWELDGFRIGTGMEPPENISITLSGIHELKVIARDDQEDEGDLTATILVKNPIPQVVLSGVPKTIYEGEHFTALGYRSTDNPSDISTLMFQWFVNGELIEDETGKNATFSFDSPGERTIQLRVTDDDGGNWTASLVVKVEGTPFLIELIQAAFSTLGLSIIILILVLLVILIVRVRGNMSRLKPPGKDPVLDKDEEEEGPDEVDMEDTSMGGTSIDDPDQEMVDDVEQVPIDGPSAIPEGGSMTDSVPSLEIEEMDIPDAPTIEDMDIPEPEEGLLDPIHVQ